jgi:hypothetical protein
MKKIIILTLLFSCLAVSVASVSAQNQSTTYPETRKLLIKMERVHEYKILKKLFEEGEDRKIDLIKALYDSDQKVSLNAQSMLRYLADEQSLAGLDEWIEYRKKNERNYWTSPVELVTKVEYLTGKEKDLVQLLLKNLHPNEKDFWGNLIAYNKKTKTALIETIQGEIFTEGHHVVIREENGKWRLISNSLVWQS